MSTDKKSFKSPEERQQYLDELKEEYFAGIKKSTPKEYQDQPIIDLGKDGDVVVPKAQWW